MPIVKVKLDAPLAAGEHDLDISGVVPDAEVKEKYLAKESFATELDSRVKSITKGMVKPEDLLKVGVDDPFYKNFIEAKREDLVKTLDIKLDPKNIVDVGKIQTETMETVRRTELTPALNAIKEKDGEIGILRERDLSAQVAESAMDFGVVKDLRELVQMHVKSKFGWSPEYKQYFKLKDNPNGPDDFEISADPVKGGAPYVKVKEYMETLSRDASKKAWFEDRKQPGADFKGGGSGKGAKNLTVEQYNKMAPAERTKWGQDYPTEFQALMQTMRTAGESALFNKR